MRAMSVAVLLVCACACPSKPKPNGGGGSGGGGSGSGGPAVDVAECERIKPKVEGLYRGELKREDLVADNTAMVMRDCKKDPGLVVPCADRVGSVADLEKQCLIPLNPDGTEGK